MIVIDTNTKKPLEFEDAFGNTATLYYRSPTPEERIAYSNGLIKAKGLKIKNDSAGVRMRAGKRVCTGMEEGEWGIKVPKSSEHPEGIKPLSSDPNSPHYDKMWKELLWQHHGGYLQLLGQAAFEDVTVDAGGKKDEEDEDDLFGDEDAGEEAYVDDIPQAPALPPVSGEIEDERGKSSEISNL